MAGKTTERLLKELEGVHTIDSITRQLDITRRSAVNYVHMLKKEGYVKTKEARNRKKIYYISRLNRQGGKSHYDILNEESPIKLSPAGTHKIHGRQIPLEETLIYAIKTRKLRAILASLALFRNITGWKLLADMAKQDNTRRIAGCLYDLARRIMRTRRMSMKFRKSALPSKGDKFIHIIDGMESKDFKDIESAWKVYLPFNKSDLQEYMRK